MMYLIDTDWVIDYLDGDEEVVRRVKHLLPSGIGISVVSLAELYEGIAYSRNPVASETLLRVFLDDLDIVPLDEDVCRLFGVERGRLRSAGMLIGDFDLLIGCTAKLHGLTVLTNNLRHFTRIPELSVESI